MEISFLWKSSGIFRRIVGYMALLLYMKIQLEDILNTLELTVMLNVG